MPNTPYMTATSADTFVANMPSSRAGDVSYARDTSGNVNGLTIVTNTVPLNNLPGSIMFIGDSITFATGVTQSPQCPQYVPCYKITISLANNNAQGQFVTIFDAHIGNPTGNGTLRFYIANNSMTWQAFGETEGALVPIVLSGYYTLKSSGATSYLYLGIIAGNKPLVDAADVVNNSGFPYPFVGNSGSFLGFANVVTMLRGNQFSHVYNYGIPAINSTQWLANSAFWSTTFSDITVIMLGTNDTPTIATIVSTTLPNILSMVAKRMGIGSRVIVGCLPPNGAASVAINQAYNHLNNLLKINSKSLGFDIFDCQAAVGNPNTVGVYQTNNSTDTTHPNNRGSYNIAYYALNPMLDRLLYKDIGRVAGIVAYDATLSPQGNLLPNPGLLGTGGNNGAGVTGTVPSNMSAQRAVGAVLTIVSIAPGDGAPVVRTDGVQGNWWQLTLNNGTTGVNGETCQLGLLAYINGANYAVGDLLVVEGEINLSAATGNGFGSLNIYLQHATPIVQGVAVAHGDTAYTLGTLNGGNVTIPFRSNPVKVQTGATQLQIIIDISMAAGIAGNTTGVVKIGQNLTLRKA